MGFAAAGTTAGTGQFPALFFFPADGFTDPLIGDQIAIH